LKEYIKFYAANHGKFKGQAIVTVVNLMDEGKFGRGVSVCSPGDQPDPVCMTGYPEPADHAGMFHAKNYAMRAIKGRGDILITDDRAIRALLSTDCPFVYHSQNMPILTWQEKRFFFGKAKFLEWKKGFVQTYRNQAQFNVSGYIGKPIPYGIEMRHYFTDSELNVMKGKKL